MAANTTRIVFFFMLTWMLLQLFSGSNTTTTRNLDEPYELDEKLYDLSCPLGLFSFIGRGMAQQEALEYSLESEAQSIIKEALLENSHKNRKIVLIGDSNMRQIFSSLACMAYSLGLWESDDSYVAFRSSQSDKNGNYNDARLKLKGDLGEIYLAASGGKISTYGWTGLEAPLDGNEDWLPSCKNRQPFQLDTLSYSSPNEKIEFSSFDSNFDKILLNENDIVIFNPGLHRGFRDENIARFSELLDCMNQAKSYGDTSMWPQIMYFRTNQQHFKNVNDNPGGAFTPGARESACLDVVKSEENPFFIQDMELFSGKLPLIGFHHDLSGKGKLHVGQGDFIDCSHWTQPGVPDVYAKEIALSIFEVSTLELLELS